PSCAGARVRRRRKKGGRVCWKEGARCRVTRTLGAECTLLLHGLLVSCEVQERRIHRIPRFMESSSGAAGRIQRRLPAAEQGWASRRRIRSVRRQLCAECRVGTRKLRERRAPSDGFCARARRITVGGGRYWRAHLSHRVRRQVIARG